MRSLATKLMLVVCAASTGVSAAGRACAQVAQPIHSATIARDVNGFSLGAAFSDIKRQINLRDNGGGTFIGEKYGIKYEFDFTPVGRVYSIRSYQNIGNFTVDTQFDSALGQRLRQKYGNPVRVNPWHWSLVETVDIPGVGPMTRATNTLDVSTQENDGSVILSIQMEDVRILYRDKRVENSAPRDSAVGLLRF